MRFHLQGGGEGGESGNHINHVDVLSILILLQIFLLLHTNELAQQSHIFFIQSCSTEHIWMLIWKRTKRFRTLAICYIFVMKRIRTYAFQLSRWATNWQQKKSTWEFCFHKKSRWADHHSMQAWITMCQN